MSRRARRGEHRGRRRHGHRERVARFFRSFHLGPTALSRHRCYKRRWGDDELSGSRLTDLNSTVQQYRTFALGISRGRAICSGLLYNIFVRFSLRPLPRRYVLNLMTIRAFFMPASCVCLCVCRRAVLAYRIMASHSLSLTFNIMKWQFAKLKVRVAYCAPIRPFAVPCSFPTEPLMNYGPTR